MIFPILLLALILRLINLNQSLWLDEAVQAITAKSSFFYIFLEIIGDFHPPLYHFFMHYWVSIFGSSEIALRMPSVLFGVGTVYLIYKISGLIINELFINGLKNLKIFPIIAALFLATAPFHIYYSQETRMYSMACFLTALSMFSFIKINGLFINGLKNSKINGLYFIYFLSTILMLYSDYFGFLILLAQGIYSLPKKKYRYFIFYLLFFICYLPWLPILFTQLKTGMQATQTLPEWVRLVNLSFLKAIPLTLIKFSLGRITFFDKKLYLIILVGLVITYGGLILKGIKGMLKEDKGLLGVILCWFFVPLVIAWLTSLFVPNFQPFRLLLILPAFYLLLLFGIFSFKSKALRFGLIILVLIINLSSLAVYYFNPFFQREDWKGLVNYLKHQENSVVLLPSETSNWPIRYYDPESKIKLVYRAKGIAPINGLSINGLTDYGPRQEKIYYIRYLSSLFDPNELILAELKEAGYTKVKEVNFNQIPLWEYRLLTDYQLTD